jgi:hypothetical protein
MILVERGRFAKNGWHADIGSTTSAMTFAKMIGATRCAFGIDPVEPDMIICNPINVESIRDILLPGLRCVVGQYRDWPAQWGAIFAAERKAA